MFCRNCGASNPDDVAKCAQCGADLAVPPQQPTGPATPPPSAPFTPSTPPASMPPNWLWLGIVTAILCCPIGLIPAIVSIVFSSQVSSKYNMGDYAGALDSSNKAKIWGFVALGLGVVAAVISFAIGFMGAMSQHPSLPR